MRQQTLKLNESLEKVTKDIAAFESVIATPEQSEGSNDQV